MNAISIVVPTLNEQDNIAMLVKRIDESLEGTGIVHEIIFVDDKSKDRTIEEIEKLQHDYPVSYATKVGPRGKAFSLLQGFKMAQYETICMIDADLQYPPEAIAPMYKLMEESDVDLVLTERVEQETSLLRQLSSKVFNFTFTRMLFGFHYDTQSGLKLFRKKVVKKAKLNPTPWSFDLEFIVRALENNFTILSYQIPFSSRFGGETKVRVLKLTYELAKASLKLRFTSSPRKVKQAYRVSLRLADRLGMVLLLPLLAASIAIALPDSTHATTGPLVGSTVKSVKEMVVTPSVQTILTPPFLTPTQTPTMTPVVSQITSPSESNTSTTPQPAQSQPSTSSNSQTAIPSSSSQPVSTNSYSSSDDEAGARLANVNATTADQSITYPSIITAKKGHTVYSNDNTNTKQQTFIIGASIVILAGMIMAGISLFAINRYQLHHTR